MFCILAYSHPSLLFDCVIFPGMFYVVLFTTFTVFSKWGSEGVTGTYCVPVLFYFVYYDSRIVYYLYL